MDVCGERGSTDTTYAPAKKDGENPPAKKDGENPPAKKDGENPPEKNDGDSSYSYCYLDKLAYFSYDYVVETKTDGNGTVKASKIRSSAGEVIEFTVEPNDGYTLGVVKVTDAKGNIIMYTDKNTFTMPNADVLIEATFVKSAINPATATGIGIGLLAIIALASGYYAIKQRRFVK